MTEESNQKTKEAVSVRAELRKQTVGFLLAALGLVAGLAWNDAIKAFIEKIFPLETNGLVAKFIYAIIITVVVVFVTRYVMRLIDREPKA